MIPRAGRPAHRRDGRRRHPWMLAAGAAAVVLSALTACVSAPELTPPSVPAGATDGLGPVDSIAVVGDSISLGMNACGAPGPCPEFAWATGTDPGVASLAWRLGEAEGAPPATDVFARDGGTVAQLAERVPAVVAAAPDVVAVLVGGNDACAPTFDGMTSAAAFDASIRTLLGGLSAGLPDATILALSVPDLNRMWEVEHTDRQALERWSASTSCRSLLWAADSDAAEDVDRRAAVAARVDDFNVSIAAACAELPNCVGDDGAVHAYGFAADELSALDHFHPSAAGQQAIAGIAWTVLTERAAADAKAGGGAAGAPGAAPSLPARAGASG